MNGKCLNVCLVSYGVRLSGLEDCHTTLHLSLCLCLLMGTNNTDGDGGNNNNNRKTGLP
jgi:hypothetical protein